jgi:hypothetical protein
MPGSIQDAFEQFVAVAKKKNVTRLNERSTGYGVLTEAVKRAAKQ